MLHQVKLQYIMYIYYFKITQERGCQKILGQEYGGAILNINKVWGVIFFKVEIQKNIPAPPPLDK